MRNFVFVLASIFVSSAALQAGDGLPVRYRTPSGGMALAVTHDIELRAGQTIEAHRNLSIDLAFATDPPGSVTVTIEDASGTNEAHGMKQRLGTRQLTGKTFALSIADDGRRLERSAGSDAPPIELGPMVPGGLSVAELLEQLLPALPDGPVAVGTEWTTEREIHSLEGWAWGKGRLSARHRVTAVDRAGGHAVVSVTSSGEARLGAVEGERRYSGTLKRTASWRFDATDGRLLSLTLDQETDGSADLGGGDTPVSQRAHVELAPRS